MEIEKCSYCSGAILAGEFCDFCVTSFKSLPGPKEMSGEGRKKELEMLIGGVMTVPISMVLNRIQELIGRELNYGDLALSKEALLEEAYNNNL